MIMTRRSVWNLDCGAAKKPTTGIKQSPTPLSKHPNKTVFYLLLGCLYGPFLVPFFSLSIYPYTRENPAREKKIQKKKKKRERNLSGQCLRY